MLNRFSKFPVMVNVMLSLNYMLLKSLYKTETDHPNAIILHKPVKHFLSLTIKKTKMLLWITCACMCLYLQLYVLTHTDGSGAPYGHSEPIGGHGKLHKGDTRTFLALLYLHLRLFLYLYLCVLCYLMYRWNQIRQTTNVPVHIILLNPSPLGE